MPLERDQEHLLGTNCSRITNDGRSFQPHATARINRRDTLGNMHPFPRGGITDRRSPVEHRNPIIPPRTGAALTHAAQLPQSNRRRDFLSFPPRVDEILTSF